MLRLGKPLRILSVLLLFAAPVQADDAKPGSGPLDGMTFVGKFGPAGEALDVEDRLHFDNGRFWSAACVKCGFQPGAYWVRQTPSGVQFRGELIGERGRFSYRGRVNDGRIEVQINWRKERWYWTIDRDFRFEGILASARTTPSAREASRVAAAVGPERPPHCRL